MVRGHKGTPARVCAVTIAVQHLLRSGDGGGTTAFQRRRHHSRGPDGTLLDRVRRAVWGMLSWDRVHIASRASEDYDGYRGGIRCLWLDRVGEK